MIIDQLPLLAGDVQTTDEIPIERGTTTYKTTQTALVKSAADAAAAAQTAADNAQTAADNAQTAADNAQTAADAAQQTANSKQDALVSGVNIKTVGGQSLLGSGNIDAGGSRTLLWTNPNPDAAFNAQTITLSDSASNFAKIEVVFFVNNTVSNRLTEIVQFEPGYRMHAWYWGETGGASSVAYFMVRQISSQVTGTTIDFANLFHTPPKGTVSQNVLVPWKVYGLRA